METVVLSQDSYERLCGDIRFQRERAERAEEKIVAMEHAFSESIVINVLCNDAPLWPVKEESPFDSEDIKMFRCEAVRFRACVGLAVNIEALLKSPEETRIFVAERIYELAENKLKVGLAKAFSPPSAEES